MQTRSQIRNNDCFHFCKKRIINVSHGLLTMEQIIFDIVEIIIIAGVRETGL